jgi:hypothetical protein
MSQEKCFPFFVKLIDKRNNKTRSVAVLSYEELARLRADKALVVLPSSNFSPILV